jgi:expansin (peptidoglycan-binding protein)
VLGLGCSGPNQEHAAPADARARDASPDGATPGPGADAAGQTIGPAEVGSPTGGAGTAGEVRDSGAGAEDGRRGPAGSAGGSAATGGAGGGGAAGTGGAAGHVAGGAGGMAGARASAGASGGAAGAGGGTAGAGGGAAGGGGGAVACRALPGYADGSVTWYTLEQGSQAVNCSYDIVRRSPDVVANVPFGGGTYFAAMNTADYANAATCGACVEVTRDGMRKVDVTIVDQCPTATNPKCTAGHIDLSQAAFEQIGTVDEGYLGTSHGGDKGHISWTYIPCPVTSPVSFRLKDASNVSWNQILVQNHRTPIAKLEVDVNRAGSWQPATRQSYNYWQLGGGNLGAAPYHVRATDVDGATLEASLALQGGDQSSGSQFPTCR